MVVLKQETDGTFRLTYKGVGIAAGAMIAAMVLGVSGVVNSTDRFTGTQAGRLLQRIDALETIIDKHEETPCHGKVCVQLGRMEERLDNLTREHYDDRIKGIMDEIP